MITCSDYSGSSHVPGQLTRRLFLQACASALLLACDSEPEHAAASSKTVGIAYALGGKGDQSYNDAAAKALPRLRELYEVREFSPLTLEDYTRAITTLTRYRPRIIFCIGFIYDPFVDNLASKYPDTLFVVIDGRPARNPNSLGIQFKVEEASALAGVVAADFSKTQRIGFVGGSDIPPIREFLAGYEAGAKRLSPSIDIITSYVGAGAEAFKNAARGKDIALGLINAGADVLFHAAGSSGNGVIAAAHEKAVLAIGVDVDQTYLAPGTVITSVIKRVDLALLAVAESSFRGERVATDTLSMGLSDGGVEIYPQPRLSADAAEVIASLRAQYGAAS